MGANVLDHIFGLTVGNERVSLQHDLFTHESFKNITFRENCDRENYEAPYLFSKFEKEQLGTALLVTVGFDHLSKRFCRV